MFGQWPESPEPPSAACPCICRGRKRPEQLNARDADSYGSLSAHKDIQSNSHSQMFGGESPQPRALVRASALSASNIEHGYDDAAAHDD